MIARLSPVAALVVVLVAAATIPQWVSSYYVGIATSALFFVGLAAAWNIVGGIAGQFSLGNSLFMAMGGTVVAALVTLHGWNVWLATIIAAVGAALIALIVSALMFRRALPQLSFALVTLALAEVGLLLVTSTGWIGAASGVIWDQGFASDDATYFYIALAAAVAVVGISWLLYRSRLGYRMRAIRDDEPAAAAVGTNLFRVKTTALVISAVLTSVLATLYANYAVFVDPNSFASPVTSISVILYAVVGGVGTVRGPVIGAVLLFPIGEVLRGKFGDLPGLSYLVLGLAIVLIVLFAPRGIAGLVDQFIGWTRGRGRRGLDNTERNP